MSVSITKDIKFDRYGDFSFFSNDIETITGTNDIMYQNTIDRLISNFGDYSLNGRSSIGADLSSLIGRPVTESLEVLVRSNIVLSLTSDGFLDVEEVNVITFVDHDNILIRINVAPTGLVYPLSSAFRINSIFHTSSGLLHVTD